MNLNLLDQYESNLALVLAPLPPEKRAQVLAEVRAHLEAMIEARRADGMSAERATEEALQGFGAAELIGRELLDEWARGPRMEARGTPMSRREKVKVSVRLFIAALVLRPLMEWLLPRLEGWEWEGVAKTSFWVMCLAYGMWHSQKTLRWIEKPACRFVVIVNVMHILVVLILCNFVSVPASHAWLLSILSSSWILIYLLLSTIGLAWYRRERKVNPPWRDMMSYRTNPVATEDRYRLNELSAFTLSWSIGALSTLWLVGVSYGSVGGLIGIAALLSSYGLLYRWIR